MMTRGLTHAVLTVVAVMAVVLCLTLPGTKAWAQDVNPGVCPNGSQYYGKFYGEWSAEWWKWAWSIPRERSPLFDATGEFAGESQGGPVWFLAGASGEGEGPFDLDFERTCTIPAGKALFFPIVNTCYINFPEDPWDPSWEEYWRAAIAGWMDTAEGLSCTIDGDEVYNLQRYRVVSPVYYLAPSKCDLLRYLYDLPNARYGPCVDDGYYLMLAPLEVGEHTIHFEASLGPGWFTLDITYHLTVVQ